MRYYVTVNMLKEDRILERRALLQSIRADEKLISELEAVLNSEGENQDTYAAFRKCVTMIRSNAQERRKAFLQIVRNTEKQYGLKKSK